MDYDSFVTRLRITRSYLANHPTHGSWEEAGVVEQAADAIVALRSDLAAAQARVAELERSSVMNDTYTREIARTQRAEAERDRLQADLAAARADATLLRSTLIDIAAVMGMSSLPSYSEWEKIRNKALQLVAALAGEKK